MTPASDVALAREWAETLEDRESRRHGISVQEARPIVARKTGVPTGKLYSLRRDRLKDVGNSILQRLGMALIRDLQTELARVEHDLQTAIQIGLDRHGGEVQSLLASRQKIRAALNLED